jgi:flavin reductase (DIM6/NTAB) family NADH-FMN oxidoreductase RutF
MKKITITIIALIMSGAMLAQNTQIMEAKFEPISANVEKTFDKISPKEIPGNVIRMIADEWLLVTAGTKDHFNMMTASWGSIGHLWNEPVVMVFIRPQRYTYEFMEKEKFFTVTVFSEKYRDILNFCGSKSGRDYNKVKETGLIPVETPLGNIYFEQAKLVIECEKIYADNFEKSNFTEPSIASKIYPAGDFHKMYIGKIVNVWIGKE